MEADRRKTMNDMLVWIGDFFAGRRYMPMLQEVSRAFHYTRTAARPYLLTLHNEGYLKYRGRRLMILTPEGKTRIEELKYGPDATLELPACVRDTPRAQEWLESERRP